MYLLVFESTGPAQGTHVDDRVLYTHRVGLGVRDLIRCLSSHTMCDEHHGGILSTRRRRKGNRKRTSSGHNGCWQSRYYARLPTKGTTKTSKKTPRPHKKAFIPKLPGGLVAAILAYPLAQVWLWGTTQPHFQGHAIRWTSTTPAGCGRTTGGDYRRWLSEWSKPRAWR